MLIIFAMALLLSMPKPSLVAAFKPIYQPWGRSNLPHVDKLSLQIRAYPIKLVVPNDY